MEYCRGGHRNKACQSSWKHGSQRIEQCRRTEHVFWAPKQEVHLLHLKCFGNSFCWKWCRPYVLFSVAIVHGSDPTCVWIANQTHPEALCDFPLPWPPYISTSVPNIFGICYCVTVTVCGLVSCHFLGTLYHPQPHLLLFLHHPHNEARGTHNTVNYCEQPEKPWGLSYNARSQIVLT